MKKLISLLSALVLCLALCACGSSTPSVETLISLADEIVNNYEPVTDDAPYKFKSLGYDDEENAYMVAVMTDPEKVSQLISEMDVDKKYVNQMIDTAIQLYDKDTETIALELSALKLKLEANFTDTDVAVMIGFFDQSGEVVQISD